VAASSGLRLAPRLSPTVNAFLTADEGGRTVEPQRELDELFASHNEGPRADARSIPATFLRVGVSA